MKTKFLVLLLMGFITLLSSCSNGKKLYVYSWTYYIPDEVLVAFEQETGIQLIYDMFSSNEEMFAKLFAGGTGYDVVLPSSDYVSIMAKEGMIEPLDKARISTYDNLDWKFLNRKIPKENLVYGYPFMFTIGGIAVNKRHVPTFEESWNIFARVDLKNRMTMMDDMREVLGAALKTLGYSANTINLNELEAAKKVAMVWRNNLLKFDSESFAKGFASEEFYVVQGFPENIFLEYEPSKQNEVAFFIPKEGGVIALDSFVIMKDAKHKDEAYLFMDYMQRPEVNAKVADYLNIPSFNLKSQPLMTKTPKYDYNKLETSELKLDLGRAIEMYNKIWQEIRIGED